MKLTGACTSAEAQHPSSFKPRHRLQRLMTLCQHLTASILAYTDINTSCRFRLLFATVQQSVKFNASFPGKCRKMSVTNVIHIKRYIPALASSSGCQLVGPFLSCYTSFCQILWKYWVFLSFSHIPCDKPNQFKDVCVWCFRASVEKAHNKFRCTLKAPHYTRF